MQIGQTIYYLEQGKKFPNIYACNITFYDGNKLTIETNAEICKCYSDRISIENLFIHKKIHMTLIDAIEERRKMLNEFLVKQTRKHNTLIKKIDKWKNKKK